MAFIQIHVSQTYHAVMQATFERTTPQKLQRDGEATGVTQQIINNG